MGKNLQICPFRPAQWDLFATKMLHNHVKEYLDFAYYVLPVYEHSFLFPLVYINYTLTCLLPGIIELSVQFQVSEVWFSPLLGLPGSIHCYLLLHILFLNWRWIQGCFSYAVLEICMAHECLIYLNIPC